MTGATPTYTVHAGSDVGQVRTGNEDSYYAGEAVIAVADGMGGHVGGEIASSRALGPIEQLDGTSHPSAEAASEALGEAIAEANRLVLDQGEANPELSGMGTTLTAAMIREGRLHVAHVGDSRAYLLRGGELTQLTSDHTLVEQMVRNGQISRAEAAVHPHRSVLTRAIGVDRAIEVDTLTPVPLQPGDQVLLCSDGLTGPLDEGELTRLLGEHDDGEQTVQALIDAANDAGGPDNITVVLLRVDSDDGRSAAAPPAAAAAGGDATTQLEAEGHPPAERPPTTRAISTAPPVDADSRDWARQFSRYGQPQGADGGGEPGGLRPSTRRRLTRLVAGVLAVVLLLVLLGAGGYALLTRAYFVGQEDDEIVVFQGIPQTVLGVDLFWTVEETGLDPEGLPSHMQSRLEEGLMATSLAEARQIVERHERAIREADEDREDEESDEAGGDGDTGSAEDSP